MIDVDFVYLGAAIGLAGQAGYVVATLQGRTQPNRVTWLLWALAPLLAFGVEVQEGVGLRSLTTFVFGFGPLAVFLASFANRASVWRLGRLDYVCGALSLGGTAWWLATRQGTVAIGAAVGADALAAVPTLVKSWWRPETEHPSVYVGSFLNGFVTLLTVTTVSAAELTFPLYIVVITAVEVVLVAGRLGPRLRRRALAPGVGDGPLPDSAST
ncbi:MAG TPA: hypothetical protein VMB72_06220 [Acidimicrobiales bacterium]|nr:hypothetical protein [Acidimicrobiales bacterium]